MILRLHSEGLAGYLDLTMHRCSLIISAFFCVTLAAACGDDHGHTFSNLDACVVDHISLGEPEAIAHCLFDFPDLHPTFADQQACVDWVEANGGYPNSRDAACTDYFLQLGQ